MLNQKARHHLSARNFRLNLGLFAALTALVLPELTGVLLHQLLGTMFSAGILLHLVWHWHWVISITRRFFRKIPRQTKINYLLNWSLFISLIASVMTGLAISSWVTAVPDLVMVEGHEIMSGLFTFMVVIHLARHWRWILKMVRFRKTRAEGTSIHVEWQDSRSR